MSRNKYIYDQDGYKYKFPHRSCRVCRNYPCFGSISKMKVDFAKYGCEDYKDD